ncbi:MAG: hypothetical protein J6J51_07025 [Clostridia bacterium]|nr:hypothetical protein [Clostridia bacterium]
MKKSVYSLVLSDDVIAAVDRAAYQNGLSRSAMINRILAQAVSYTTPEQRMREIFSQVERLLNGEVFQSLSQPSDSMMSLRSALAYKYNPNVRYSVELYPDRPGEGELRVSLRSQSSALILYLGQFFRLWAKIEQAYVGGADCVIQDGKYARRLKLPARVSHREQGAVLAGYIRAMEQGLRAFFHSLDDPRQAATLVEQAYQNYLKQYPAI